MRPISWVQAVSQKKGFVALRAYRSLLKLAAHAFAAVIMGSVLLLAPPASAQTQNAPEAAANITWVTRPPFGQMPNIVRGGELRLRVRLRCTVRSGALADCAATDSPPPAYLENALAAASRAQVAPTDALGASTEGRVIDVTIGFPIPVAIDPPPAPPNATRLSNLVWLDVPDADDYTRLYPSRAWAEDVGGQVTLDCIVNGDGRLSCAVTAEDPIGYGFGDATLRAAREMRVARETSDGQPTAGGRVGRTVRWRTEPLRNR